MAIRAPDGANNNFNIIIMFKLRALDFLKISPGWYSENIPLVDTLRTYDSFVHVGGSNVFDMA